MAAPVLPTPSESSQETIAELVRSARERKGLSQNQAFQVCGVSRLTYRMWEKGTWEQIRLRYVPTLARFCDTTEEDILEHMGVLTHDAAEALRRARKRGTVQGVVNEDGLTGWETGRYLQWWDEAGLNGALTHPLGATPGSADSGHGSPTRTAPRCGQLPQFHS